MELSNEYKARIDELLNGYKLSVLKEASFSIIDSYHQDKKDKPVIDNDLKARIYAVTRMPATYKAVSEVFEHTFELYNPNIDIALDIGAGLGAASRALSDLHEVKHINLYEKEEAMRKLGMSMNLDKPVLYHEFDITKNKIEDKYDLVMSSYVLNEIDESIRKEVILKMFNATNDLLVIVEPGTPNGYKIMLEAREALKNSGAHIIAPCPNVTNCPMKNSDWCHFATRVQRSKLHKVLKEGDSPFEDEKYTYIVFSKKADFKCESRVLRHPIINKRLIKLTTCSKEGIQELEIRKSHPKFKMAKKIKVGDSF